MKKYFAIFHIRFVNTLQYRAAALAGLSTQFAWGFMLIFSFAAFYRVNPNSFPMEFSHTVSFIWIQQAFLALFALWFWDDDIANSILDGGIAYDLVRPINLYGKWFSTSAAKRLARAVLRCIPILFVAFILPAPYRLILPPSLLQFALFILSTTLGLGVVVAFAMLVYTSLFYTVSPSGIRVMVMVLGDFLSGGIVPLPFFPAPVRNVVELLPFASMLNMPARIYSGSIAGMDALSGILLQCFWLAALVLIGTLISRRVLKRVIVQGG
ncbi:MAG: ABC transporter permease [Defluviitaleaceae bacterium]|nr:ABC transporter permease [Defluviitaleaceae bacterium]